MPPPDPPGDPPGDPQQPEPEAGWAGERWRAIIENVSDLVAEVDGRGFYTFASPNHRLALGFEPAELVGRRSVEFVHPEDVDGLRQALAKMERAGDQQSVAARVRRSDGSWAWFESAVRLREDEAGEKFYVCVARDVSERRARDEEQELLARVGEALGREESVCSVAHALSRVLGARLPFDLLFVSLVEEEGMRVAASDLEEGDCSEIFFDIKRSERPDLWELIEAAESANIPEHDLPSLDWWARQTGRPISELRPGPRSNLLTRSFMNVPLRIGGRTIGLLHFDSFRPNAFDAAHLRLAEQVAAHIAAALRRLQLLDEARRAEKRFRDLVAQVDAIVWEADPKLGSMTFVSPRVRAWLGADPQSWLGPFRDNFALWIHPEDREPTLQQYAALSAGGVDHALEFRLLKRPQVLEGNGGAPEVLGAGEDEVVWVRDIISVEVSEGVPVRLHGLMLDITQRRAELAERKLLESAVEAAASGVSMLDARREGAPIFYVNRAWQAITGRASGEVIGRPFFEASGFEAGPQLDRLQAAVEERRECRALLLKRRPDGRRVWAELSLSPVRDGGGEVSHFIAVESDVSKRQAAEERVRESNAILQATQEAAADGILVVDEAGSVVSCNRRFARLWQIPEDLVAELRHGGGLMEAVLDKMSDPGEFLACIAFLSGRPGESTRDEVRLKDGRTFERYSAPAVAPDGKSYGRAWSFSDITERKSTEIALRHQAFHDPLTGLPNRAFFLDTLGRVLTRARRSGETVAVLFLDLDRFKIINDSLGHDIGDLLLAEAAARLRGCLRPGDLAGRFGGDEFTVLLENVSHVADATHVAGRIAEVLSAPFDLGGHEVYTTTSVGIVLSRPGGDRAEDLLRDADVAMYRAKSKGRARYEIFDAEMSAEALARLRMEIDLRQALKRGHLRVFYQPLVNLQTGRIIGAEALVRWQHPDKGLILPGEFIELAEESGMIFALGAWVLREVCGRARAWSEWAGESEPFHVSVNISAKQFHGLNLAEEVGRVLQEARLDARRLNLEITESVMLSGGALVTTVLAGLRDLGVRLSLDDFGTGFSSLSYLKQFPLDTLKIDRSFVSRHEHEGEDSEQNAAIVQAVYALGRALKMAVVAEGVETSEQLERLRALGCDIGQGFFFSRALPAEEFEALLKSRPAW